MDKFFAELKGAITIKTLVSIVSVGAVVPLCKALYWTFETSYFGYFGVSPEVFSRPLFSSGFISVWLFVTAMYPMFFAWTGVMAISFLFLVSFNYEEPRFGQVGNENKEKSEVVAHRSGSKIEKVTWRIRSKAVLSNLLEAIEKSSAIPFIFWVSGCVALLAVMFLFLWADKKGRGLAKNLVDGYMSHMECKDGFNNRVIGCFEVVGVEGNNHFVITNSKTHLVYLSRYSPAAGEDGKSQESEFPQINIIEKAPGETFKIRRIYKIQEKKEPVSG